MLDIRLPDISGFDVCRQLRAEGKIQPVLMLTARDEQIDKVLGLEIGADDYLVKPYQLHELLARIRALLRRAYGELAAAGAQQRLIFGTLEIDLERQQICRQGQLISLTPIEFRLLRLPASQPGRPFNRELLIELVWGYESPIGSDRTVDVHIRHLREKLEEDPTNPQWIRTVRGVGYEFYVAGSNVAKS